MEEAELLKERLQAITDKRKLQEEITQKRHTVEEEKIKLQHLKKKALRKKWLLDGLNMFTPKELEEMQKQNQEDQQQMDELEQNVLRVEKEIEDLEKKELIISAKEKAILKRLKSVERTTEDIIKSVKVERVETKQEAADYIYANIPDLPKSFKPSALKRTRHLETENDDEEDRKALFAMEIKVEKDNKTGENTVLSTIPLPSEDFKGAGVKVYDDGRKSIYAVCANGSVKNSEVDGLAPIEVEELLRQATEKQSKSPTEYHEPVYSNEFCRPATPLKDKLAHELIEDKGAFQDKLIRHDEPVHNTGKPQQTGENSTELSKRCQSNSHSPVLQQTERSLQISPQNKMAPNIQREVIQEVVEPHQKMRTHQQDLIPRNSVNTHDSPSPMMLKSDEDSSYSVVHAVPCYVDDTEPVTMIFMGYQHVDDEELNKTVCGYDGLIHAEFVVIDDEGEEGDTKEDTKAETPLYHPVGAYSQVYQPPNQTSAVTQANSSNIVGDSVNKSPYKNSISLKEQEESLSSSTYNGQLNSQLAGDGTEDPSLTVECWPKRTTYHEPALRMRMAKLGKKVI